MHAAQVRSQEHPQGWGGFGLPRISSDRFMGYGGVEGAGRLWFYEPSSRELLKGADLFQSTLLTPNAGKTFRMNA